MHSFDYESKVWGTNEVRLEPTYLNALRLKYCLDDLQGVQGRVLEVGCGGGGMARAVKLYRPDLEVHACDVSRAAIDAAQSRNGGVTYTVGDVSHLAFPAHFFSAVLMFDVLEHLESPERAAGEIHSVLEPGGLFHLFVPCEGSVHALHGLLARAGWTARERFAGHIQRFTPADLSEILVGTGFSVINGRWSGHLVNQLADVAYFAALSLIGRNAPTSVEGYLASAEPGPASWLVTGLKGALAAISYYESLVLRKVPGWGTHLACYKASGGHAAQ